MKNVGTFFTLLVSVFSLLAHSPACAEPQVVIYPAPNWAFMSGTYEVHAGGEKVDVYGARTLDPPFAGQYDFGGHYSFANFDMSGSVEIRIAATRRMDKVVVRPVSLGIKVKVINERTISITLDKPQKISIEPDGKNAPLLLFANPIETDVPAKDDPNVLYFGPGIHEVAGDIIRPKAGQTVYLAGGAIVKAGIEIAADNVKIKGRGVLDGSQWPWTKGPFRNMIAVDGAKQTEIEGITILGSPKWTVCMRNSDDVTIRNLKLCGSRVQNDDGINPCNTRNVLVTDCFIRSDDDCLALKGLNADGQDVENIVVENSTLWCDRARITLLGHESRAAYMRNITYRNIDIIHMTMTAFLLEPGEEMYLENVLFENIRIHGEGQKSLARMKPVVNQYMRTKSPGFVKNVIFRNIKIHGGNPGDYWFQMVGADEKHTTTDIRFENVSINGKPMTKDSPQTQIGPHTSGIKFRRTQE